METLTNSVLVLGQELEDLNLLQSMLNHVPCQVAIAKSPEQAVSLSSQTLPSLVILSGNCHQWSSDFVYQLREQAKKCGVTIIALTDCHAPSWLHQESHLGLDGYLVKPLATDILMSVVESARLRRFCCFQ
ncbi:response regulator [Roseofilum sp. BLCC_M154]|jgi:DNA-binding response OmpR family regulator|uniref:Response regulator n=1 Tax=Roseofilum acuticapitatum BLCC-M154 TaxID=3022444 RepID=A0ABT7AQ86_9CYAN|nr:response regulator [Roseofilum acuticapitatum]MDJ1169067.1 response regulator [Roseofilum acuticapitatum BLCC-M154]